MLLRLLSSLLFLFWSRLLLLRGLLGRRLVRTICNRIEVQVAMLIVTMEWFMVKLVILACSTIAMNHRSMVGAPVSFTCFVEKFTIPDLLSMDLIDIVRVR